MLIRLSSLIGSNILRILDLVGIFSIFIFKVIESLLKTRLKINVLFYQMQQIGVNSFLISCISGIFAGSVLVIQTYKGFQKFAGEQFIGPVVALSMTRELGPVLCGFMVAGRCSSAIAAEIGTMRITEQLDALKTLKINIFQYLIVPRVLAGIIILPFLAIICMMSGIVGGYLIATNMVGITPQQFTSGIKDIVQINDIFGGIIKAAVFGFILTIVGCFLGYYTSGGAQGVGAATTKSVVISSMLVFLSNYFLALILFGP